MPTTSDAVLNAVMKRVVEEGCLDAQYVAPRQALGLLKAKHLPKQLKQFRHLFVAGFDGPAHHGHFYGMHWNAVSKTLVVGDDHPIGKARDLTVVLSQLLQPQKVKYVSLRPAGPGTCADSVVHFWVGGSLRNRRFFVPFAPAPRGFHRRFGSESGVWSRHRVRTLRQT